MISVSLRRLCILILALACGSLELRSLPPIPAPAAFGEIGSLEQPASPAILPKAVSHAQVLTRGERSVVEKDPSATADVLPMERLGSLGLRYRHAHPPYPADTGFYPVSAFHRARAPPAFV